MNEEKIIDVNEVRTERYTINRMIRYLNQYCYFCDLQGIVEKHHIIRTKAGGIKQPTNEIGLCANHHTLLHKYNKKFILNYSKGYFFLKDIRTNKIIRKPHPRQLNLIRQFPYNSYYNAIDLGNLEVKREVE